jgi:beta-1,4-N-acetylglucosaminyltransferase
MIFVTVGTTAFDSLIKEVDSIAKSLDTNFVCQIADGKFEPKNCEYFRFKPNLKNEYQHAEIVITHGGAGTLFESLQIGKKVIAVANSDRSDSHQTDLINALSSRNYIMACNNISDLKKSIEKIREYIFVKYESPKCNIAEEIIKFIGE